MLGYMTAKDALSAGFTHHGRYFGIPCWIGGLDATDGGVLVATKWAPLEYIMPLAHWLEQTLAAIMYPDREPVFQFAVGADITSTKFD